MTRSVIVLGMARSGTSVVTRLLNLLGVELGTERQLKAASPVNPKGFFEHARIVALNKSLLHELGGSWDRPPSPPSGWEADPAFDALRAQARAIIEEDFGGAELWGFKDPRSCLTLPFWSALIPSPRAVICHRAPVDVADSLLARDGVPRDAGLALWGRYTTAAIAGTAGLPRIFIGFDELVDQPGTVIEALAGFLDHRPSRLADGAGFDNWLDRDLRHHRSTLAENVSPVAMPSGLALLHLLLRDASRSRDSEPALRGDATNGPISDALNRLAASNAALSSDLQPPVASAHSPLAAEAIPEWSRWERYLLDAREPPLAPAHPLEGELVRVRAKGKVFLIERGQRRLIPSKRLVQLLGRTPLTISAEELAAFPVGVSVCLAFDRDGAAYLAFSGQRVPVSFGLPVAPSGLDPSGLAAADHALLWSPGSKPQRAAP